MSIVLWAYAHYFHEDQVNDSTKIEDALEIIYGSGNYTVNDVSGEYTVWTNEPEPTDLLDMLNAMIKKPGEEGYTHRFHENEINDSSRIEDALKMIYGGDNYTVTIVSGEYTVWTDNPEPVDLVDMLNALINNPNEEETAA